MDDDVIRRKQYVRQIRASFDEEDDETKEIDFDEKEPEVPPFLFASCDFFVPYFCFVAFCFANIIHMKSLKSHLQKLLT